MTVSQLNQCLFHALRPRIDTDAVCPGGDPYDYVERMIVRAAERVVTEPDLFRHPARSLFNDIRWCFGLTAQPAVWGLVATWLAAVDAQVTMARREGLDASGNPLRCPVFTRRGRPCERRPLPTNGYCPSHQHLVPDPDEALREPAAA